MKKVTVHLAIFTCLLLGSNVSTAQDNSYIYIQGDKQTPFYVKCDGKMAQRFGKNYCIVPNLHAGQVNIELLFQQNIFPPQSFTVQVPTAGHRGFLLDRQNNSFRLYDIDTRTYINDNKK